MSKFQARINHLEKTITITRAFQVAASNISSEQYQEYLKLREQYSGFTIQVEEQKHKKNDDLYGKLTYENMKSFIEGQEENIEARTAVLKEMEDVRNLCKGQRGSYLRVKEWFLNKYKDEFEQKKKEKAEIARQRYEANFLYHPENTNC